MIVIPGPASRDLGVKVAKLLHCEAIPLEFKVFPDGESYVRLKGEVRDSDVVVIQTTSPPQDSNLMRLLLIISTAKRLGARNVKAFVPYLAYARQDKSFLEGEAVSIDTIIRLIEASGADSFYTVNVHSDDIMRRFRIPAFNLSAIPILAEHLKEMGLLGAVSIAPDKGAIKLVEEASEVLRGGYGWLEKRRDRITGKVEMAEKPLDVKGRDAVVFDDIISTGGTMVAAVSMLKKAGARRIYVACVHPLMLGDSEKRILESGAEKIIGTDSVPGKFSSVSIAPIVSNTILNEGKRP
ncbi:MAG: ribose-phosphate diphosphokinase [Candidatus Bathyarchaeia archaeon]